jgi:AraC-like DNA-binding protein
MTEEKGKLGKTLYFKAQNGNGEITYFRVSEGMMFSFVKYEAEGQEGLAPVKSNRLLLEYCHKGNIRYINKKIGDTALDEGDLMCFLSDGTDVSMGFPLGHYEAIRLEIDIERFHKEAKQLQLLQNECFDLRFICKTLLDNNRRKVITLKKQNAALFESLFFSNLCANETFLKLKGEEIAVAVYETMKNRCSFQQKKEAEPDGSPKANIARRVRHELMENPAENHTIASLAKKYYVSESSLKNYYKEQFHTSIKEDLRKFRIHKACLMLADREQNISGISRQVGYMSPSKFANAFRKQVGLGPAEYRGKMQLLNVENKTDGENDIICYFGLNYQIISLNSRFCDYMEEKQEELLSGNIDELIIEEDKEKFYDTVSAAFDKGNATGAFSLQLESGITKHKKWKLSCVKNCGGEVTGYRMESLQENGRANVQKIISERSWQLEDFLEKIQGYVNLIAPDYTVIATNTSHKKHYGNIEGRKCYEYLWNRDKPCEQCTAAQVFENKKIVTWDCVFRDGGVLHCTAYPFKGENGETLNLEIIVPVTRYIWEEIRFSSAIADSSRL